MSGRAHLNEHSHGGPLVQSLPVGQDQLVGWEQLEQESVHSSLEVACSSHKNCTQDGFVVGDCGLVQWIRDRM